MKMIDRTKIENAAIAIYSKHGNRGSPAKMLPKIISAEKIKLREIDGEENFLGAFLKQPNGQLYIHVNRNIDNTGRKNFTLAHELGHFALQHYLHTASFYCNENDITEENKAISDQEKEANYFASCFLLPKERVRKKFIKQLQWCTKDYSSVFLAMPTPHGKIYSVWKSVSSNLTAIPKEKTIYSIPLKMRCI